MTKMLNKSTNYYALSEGIEKDGIKILSIDDTGRKVRVHTDEGEMMLSFQTHGIAPPGSPAPGKPGMPAQPGGAVPGQPGTTTYPNTSATRQIPNRPVRAGMNNTVNGGGASLPGAEMDPAEQYVRMHLNRAAAEKGGTSMPPLPVIGH